MGAIIYNKKGSYLMKYFFEFRDNLHFWHLRTKNYVEHIELGKFYTTLLEETDRLIEVHISVYGELSLPTDIEFYDMDLKSLEAKIEEILIFIEREENEAVKNVLIDILELTYRAINALSRS